MDYRNKKEIEKWEWDTNITDKICRKCPIQTCYDCVFLRGNKTDTYIGDSGYLRFNNGGLLFHRVIAWENRDICYISRGIKFGDCEVHHIDGNKLNNQPENLTTLPPEEHYKLHNVKMLETSKGRIAAYIKVSTLGRDIHETEKGLLVYVHKNKKPVWLPKSQLHVIGKHIYMHPWLYEKLKKKGETYAVQRSY